MNQRSRCGWLSGADVDRLTARGAARGRTRRYGLSRGALRRELTAAAASSGCVGGRTTRRAVVGRSEGVDQRTDSSQAAHVVKVTPASSPAMSTGTSVSRVYTSVHRDSQRRLRNRTENPLDYKSIGMACSSRRPQQTRPIPVRERPFRPGSIATPGATPSELLLPLLLPEETTRELFGLAAYVVELMRCCHRSKERWSSCVRRTGAIARPSSTAGRRSDVMFCTSASAVARSSPIAGGDSFP